MALRAFALNGDRMSRVTVRAKRRFYYAGRDVMPGPVQMYAVDAAAYARRGDVSLDPVKLEGVDGVGGLADNSGHPGAQGEHGYPSSNLVVGEPVLASSTSRSALVSIINTNAENVSVSYPDGHIGSAGHEGAEGPHGEPDDEQRAKRKRRSYRRRDLTATSTTELRPEGSTE